MSRALSEIADVSEIVAASLQSGAAEPVDTRIAKLFLILARTEGPLPRADHLAKLSGFEDRFRLNRALARHGLVSIERLEGWVRMLHAIATMEVAAMPLERYALHHKLDVRTLYHLCRKLMRGRWSVVRHAGLALAIDRLRADCLLHAPASSIRGGKDREKERAG